MSDLHVAVVTPTQRHAAEVRKRLTSAPPRMIEIMEAAKSPQPVKIVRPEDQHSAVVYRQIATLEAEIMAIEQPSLVLIQIDRVERMVERLREQYELKRGHRCSIDDIMRVVGEYYGLSRVDLISVRRQKTQAFPRQIAMYLCKILTPCSLPFIGRRFGNRDHTTVLHAVRKIHAQQAVDDDLVAEIENFRVKLKQPSSAVASSVSDNGGPPCSSTPKQTSIEP